MAWNEPGNKGKDPWGNNKSSNDKGPPDLDEVFRNFSKRFGKKGSGNGGSGFSTYGVVIVLGIAVGVWALSGFYSVKEAQRGVALRFGEYVGLVDPGLQWKPTFIEDVYPVDVETVRSIPASGSMLTADENVVQVEMDVQYRVTDPYKYLFSAVDANASLREATDSALRYVIGHNKMDDILTTGREAIRNDTWKELERIIKPYNLGLTIVDVNFLPARPPEEVKNAFDDAIAAQEDEQRFIREAEAYSREVEPKARGIVERMAQQADAYGQRVTLEAQGKVASFEKLLPEYKAAPEVTRQRLYLDTMQKVMSGNNKVIIDAKNSGNMMYLPLDKMMDRKPAATSHNSSPVMPQEHVDSTSMNSAASHSNIPANGRLSREERIRLGRE
ncbi:protease modulator HflK [Shewanella sp. NFH-SH190041]|uniref:FtsH protease activity modulator HflK n=1 Tax=Shewanella sp. NFH-SH190041 TaxID=2950245 RepID=UPI0021C43DF9|nr:FtsH protease activity modulator HflK [Shewanella sp. NFH-SH190041]BDM65776.1 protease modulator HflK [Shewanella sp. NFH-SH190041]